VWHASLQASADDRPILDPERLEVPFPAIERLAVEKRRKTVLGSRGNTCGEHKARGDQEASHGKIASISASTRWP
jgi:hypothetical protein